MAKRATKLTREEAENARVLRVAVIAILGMGVLAGTSLWLYEMHGGMASGVSIAIAILGALMIGATVGVLVGLVSAIVVVPCLLGKDLRLAVPIVYGASLLVLIAYVFRPRAAYGDLEPLSSALPVLASVCLCSLACRFLLPDRFVIDPDACPRCAYDLRGETERGCPECGWGRQ